MTTAPAITYTQRIEAYTEGKDPLAMLREAPKVVADLIRDVPAANLKQRPAPEKWAVVEIMAHLAEDELTSAWRFRQMLENPGVALPSFDQDLWATVGDYGSWQPAEALEMYRLLREANLRMLSRLTEEEWKRNGVHSERGSMDVRLLARHLAGHDQNHIEQIRKILGK